MWDGHRSPNSEGIKQTIRCKSMQPLWDEATFWGLGVSALRSRFRGALTPVGQAGREWTPVGGMIGQCRQLWLLIWYQSLDCIARNLNNIVLNASGCSRVAKWWAGESHSNFEPMIRTDSSNLKLLRFLKPLKLKRRLFWSCNYLWIVMPMFVQW